MRRKNNAQSSDEVSSARSNLASELYRLEWRGKKTPRAGQSSDFTLPGLTMNSTRVIAEGDNRAVSEALLLTHQQSIGLIYADPPYGVGSHFYTKDRHVTSPRKRAYEDAKGTNEIQALYELFFSLHDLLMDRGTLWVQCDWRRSAVFRILLDEIFGSDRFVNHIVWTYKTGGVSAGRNFARKHDDILVYAKSSKLWLEPHLQKSYVPTLPEPHTPSGRKLGVKRDATCDLCRHGAPGQKFRWVIGRDVWDDVPALFRNDSELLGYPTQKPERLLDRIISCASKPGDVVFDPFCGSGTTAAVAEKLGRRWIVADKSTVAIKTALRRMKNIVPKGNEIQHLTVARPKK